MKQLFPFLLLMVFSIGLTINVTAQDIGPTGSGNVPFQPSSWVKANNVVPPSPQAASLGTFGNIPINYYTGAPNISIPLYSIGGNYISAPLTLSYDVNSVKVGTIPSTTGQGWNLSAGGVINRTARGLPDTYKHYYSQLDTYNQFVRSGDHAPIELNHFFYDVMGEEIDVQPDVYQYSFPGGSGSFVILPDETILTKGYTDLTITPQFNYLSSIPMGGSHRMLVSFTIKDKKGITYEFSVAERSHYATETENVEPPQTPQEFDYFSSWYLTSIRSADGSEQLIYSYEGRENEEYYVYPVNNDLSESVTTREIITGTNSQWCNGGNTGTSSTFSSSFQTIKIYNRKFLKTIEFKLGSNLIEKINFDNEALDNLEKSSGMQINSFTVQRRWKANEWSNVRHFGFEYFDFSTTYGRLKLEKVTESGYESNGSLTSKPPYEFVYGTGGLPSPTSNSVDHWGYFNGAGNGGSGIGSPNLGELIPTFNINGHNYGRYAGRKSVFKDNGVLEIINYPTGGRTEFVYNNHPIPPDVSSEAAMLIGDRVGGFRINAIKDFTEDGMASIRQFRYVKEDGSPSGKLLHSMEYRKTSANKHYGVPTLGCNDHTCVTYECKSFTIFASNAAPIIGNHIGYSRVEEIFGYDNDFEEVEKDTIIIVKNIGKKVYHFENEKPYPHDYWEIKNGTLVKEEVFDTYGELVKMDEYEYEYRDNNCLGDRCQSDYGAKIVSEQTQDNHPQLCELASPPNGFQWFFGFENPPECINSFIFKTKFKKIYTPIVQQWKYLKSTTSMLDGVTKHTEYEYENETVAAPSAISFENSDGKIHRQEFDYTGPGPEAIPKKIVKRVDGAIVGGSDLEVDNFGRVKKIKEILPNGSILLRGTVDNYVDGRPESYQFMALPPEVFTWEKGLMVNHNNINRNKIYDYNEKRQLTSSTEIDGVISRYVYDGLERVTNIFARNNQLVSSYDYHYMLTDGGTKNFVKVYNGGDQTTKFQYIDGLGRALQTVSQGYSPDGLDVITEAVNYDDYGRVLRAFLPIESEASDGGYYPIHTGYDHDVIKYEFSPLSRETQRIFAGFGGVNMGYGSNGGDVRNHQNNGFYGSNELYRQQSVDENGNVTLSFTDKLGQLILTRRFVDGQQVNTYNTYDNRGNLAKVYPPEFETDQDEIFNYVYSYDERNRLTSKGLPNGVSTNYTYFDENDQVKTQMDNNGNLLSFEYNDYLQPTYTFLERPFVGGSAKQQLIRTEYIDTGGEGTGQPLFTEVARLDDYSPLRTEYEYDNISRVVAVKTDSHMGFPVITQTHYDGGTDRVYSTGQLVGNTFLNEFYSFDHSKRLVDTWHNGQKISNNRYNYRDELIEKNLGATSAVSYLQSIDYAYNKRGWLTHVNTLIEDSTDKPVNTCAPVPQVEGDCDNAPMIRIADLLKIRLTNDELSINCYNACADTFEVCDYTVEFAPDEFGRITEVVANGTIVDLNYPYVWDYNSEALYPNLVTDLEGWLMEQSFFYETVSLVDDGKAYILKVEQSDLAFEKINGYNTQLNQSVFAVFNTDNCQEKAVGRSDLELQELQAAMAQTTTTSLEYPVTFYEVALDDGDVYILTASELSVYRGTYRMVQCLTLSSSNELIDLISNGTNVKLSVGQFLAVRSTAGLQLLNGEACTPPPLPMCELSETIPTQFTNSLVFYFENPTYLYFPFNSYHGPTIVNTHHFENNNLTTDAIGEFEWNLGKPLPASATVTSYKVVLDYNLWACKSSHIGLHDGTNFIPIDGKDFLPIDHLGSAVQGTLELVPDALPSNAQIGTMRLVYFNGCTNAQISNVHAIVDYLGPCVPPPFCEPELPSCSPEQALFQKYLIAAIRDTMQTLEIENLPVPNSLIRVILCDGTIEYLLEHELAMLQGNYKILQTIPFATLEEEFTVEAEGDDVADVFSMRLYYQENKDDLTRNMEGAPQRNGNISNIYWQAQGQQVQRYGYSYDGLDRLKQATYSDLGADKFFSTGNEYSVSGISYDLNGNLKSLVRRGPIVNCPDEVKYGFIDILDYKQYTGNQLTSLTDQVPGHGGVRHSNSYLNYDGNGNLAHYPGKGIESIEYNYLNLPERIIFDGGSKEIRWVYDAQGTKLRKEIVENGEVQLTKDYLGSVEYVNGSIDMVYHPEGRILGGNYEYVVKDHLGNSRVSFADLNWDGVITIGGEESEVTQENHYYPFGLNMEGEWATQIGPNNKYQYNGKELNDDFGLNWSDYGLRFFDPAIGRWNTVDPLAQDYKSWSPYNYVLNSPTNGIDPNGGWVYFSNRRDAKRVADNWNTIYGARYGKASGGNEAFAVGEVMDFKGSFDEDGNLVLDLQETKEFRIVTNDDNFNFDRDDYTAALYNLINTQDYNIQGAFSNDKSLMDNHGGGRTISSTSFELYSGLPDAAFGANTYEAIKAGKRNVMLNSVATQGGKHAIVPHTVGGTAMHEILYHISPQGRIDERRTVDFKSGPSSGAEIMRMKYGLRRSNAATGGMHTAGNKNIKFSPYEQHRLDEKRGRTGGKK